MASHRGPRRTRVYDANYNIGQSYYKSALDDLDRKYHGGRTDSAPPTVPRVNFDLEDKFDSDLQSARSRASKVITDESVFDSRGMRSLRGAPISSAFDDEIDEDVKSSLSRIRANKSKISSALNDFDMEDTFSTIKRRGNLDTANKFLDLAGEDDIGSKLRSRALKSISRSEDDSNISSAISSSSFKRLAISDTSESSVNSAASMRAQASKARLADIESDMFNRSEKQLEREKRSANLKKILADNDIESVSKHVSF